MSSSGPCYILVIVIICVTSSLLHHTDITCNWNWYFDEEMLTVRIHRWRSCQSILDTYMKLTSVQLRFFDDVHNLIGLEGHLCHEDDVAFV